MAECFVGRQPIFDRDNNVFAYELLYRNSLDSESEDVNQTVATSRVVVDAFVDIGLENIVGRHRAFVNMTDKFPAAPELACLPPDRAVIALPRTIDVSAETRESLEKLKTDGYTVALSGYGKDLPVRELLPYVDLVTMDTRGLGTKTIEEQLASLESERVVKIAKQVETTERRNELEQFGFEYFQGGFLAKPEVVAGRRLPTNRMAILQLVTKISDPDLETSELEELIATDPALSLRILRYVNSPLSGLTNEVESIHHAVVLLGRDTIKDMVMLLAIASLDNSIPELITTAFVRAKFCENLAVEARLGSQKTFFTVGLFSLMDAMMAIPISELVETLPFTPEVKSALTHRTGLEGQAVGCAQSLEHGAPDGISFANIPGGRIAELYLGALAWADQATATVD